MTSAAEPWDHVVLISIDTLRSDAIAANPLRLWPELYPDLAAPRTTVLDDFAGSGTFFLDCVSAAPYTSSAHASILTGNWPLRHGLYEFFNRRLRAATAFGRARRAGRRTILKTDFPLILGPTLGFDRDVDTYLVEDDAGYLEALGAGGPTFSLVHFGGVHVPYGFHNLRYGGDAYRARVAELETMIADAPPLPKDQLLETYRDGEDAEYLLRYKRIVEHLWHAGRPDAIFDLYLRGVEHFLETRFAGFLERLLDRLAGTRWLVVLFGDHGEEYGPDSFGHFNSVTEGVLRVPLVVAGSDVPARACRSRVRTVDILPTLLDLGALPRRPGEELDGESLAPAVLGGTERPPADAYAQAYVADTDRFIAFQRRLLGRGRKTGSLPHLLYRETVWSGGHKLTRQTAEFNEYLGRLAPVDPPRTGLEAFDERAVPRPVRDPAVQARLEGMLDAYNGGRTAPAEPEPPAADEAVRRQLRAFGYHV